MTMASVMQHLCPVSRVTKPALRGSALGTVLGALNPVMRVLLDSPLHWPLSRWFATWPGQGGEAVGATRPPSHSCERVPPPGSPPATRGGTTWRAARRWTCGSAVGGIRRTVWRCRSRHVPLRARAAVPRPPLVPAALGNSRQCGWRAGHSSHRSRVGGWTDPRPRRGSWTPDPRWRLDHDR